MIGASLSIAIFSIKYSVSSIPYMSSALNKTSNVPLYSDIKVPNGIVCLTFTDSVDKSTSSEFWVETLSIGKYV